MIKFLYMGDRHNSESIPSSRIDDFVATCEAKDNEIIQLAKTHKVTAILHGGDFFTDGDKKPSIEFVSRIAKKWRDVGIPIIGIAGNHDLIGNNIKSFPNTTSGLLDELDIIKIIKDEPMHFSDGNVTVDITGTNYHANMDTPSYVDDYIVTNKTADFHIHIVHGMLTAKSYGKLFNHTLIDQIKETKADITLCGHDHVGFGVIHYNDKYFINPGAPVRLSSNEKEMEREVKVVLISIDENGIVIEEIPLKSARPGIEVLTRNHLIAAEQKKAYEASIKSGVEKLKLDGGYTITDVLDDIYKRDEIPTKIRDDITNAIVEKTKSIKATKIVAPKDAKIRKVKIKNFQSHEDTEVELDEHFNVIVGESNQGKTSILRAIRWVAENKPSGKGFVRDGESEAYVEITLQNGTIICRKVNAKENKYLFYYPNGESSEGNTKSVETAQKLLGWSNMKVGDTYELSLNALLQGDPWFLNGNTYSASERARIIGAINNTDGADAVIKDVEKANGHINDAIKFEQVEIANLTSEIDTACTNREQLLRQRALIQKAILVTKIKKYLAEKQQYKDATDRLDEINKRFNELQLTVALNHLNEQIKKRDNILAQLKTIETEKARIAQLTPQIDLATRTIDNLSPKCANLKESMQKYVAITGILKTIETAKKESAAAEQLILQLEPVMSINLQKAYTLIDNLSIIKNHSDIIARANWVIKKADEFINASHCVDTFVNDKASISSKIEKYIAIRKEVDNLSRLRVECQNNDAKLKATETEYDEAINKKIALLQEMHICPTCYSEINDATVIQITQNLKETTNE